MARTLEVIGAELRAQYPTRERVRKTRQTDGSFSRLLITSRPGDADYEAWLTESAQSIRDQELAADAAAAWQAMVKQFTDGRTKLQADLAVVNQRIAAGTTLTPAELREGFKDLLTAVLWITERIADGTIVTQRPPS